MISELGIHLIPSKYGHGRGRSYGGDASRRFNRGSPSPKPVEAGKEYEVDIIETSRQGDGIARIKGFVIFVQKWKNWKQH